MLNSTRAARLPKSVLFRKPGELILVVADHGCGISKEYSEAVELRHGVARFRNCRDAGAHPATRRPHENFLQLRRHQSESKPADQEHAPRSSDGLA